jgi:hypothetical protein
MFEEPVLERPSTDRVHNFLLSAHHMLKIDLFCIQSVLMSDAVAESEIFFAEPN